MSSREFSERIAYWTIDRLPPAMPSEEELMAKVMGWASGHNAVLSARPGQTIVSAEKPRI